MSGEGPRLGGLETGGEQQDVNCCCFEMGLISGLIARSLCNNASNNTSIPLKS